MDKFSEWHERINRLEKEGFYLEAILFDIFAIEGFLRESLKILIQLQKLLMEAKFPNDKNGNPILVTKIDDLIGRNIDGLSLGQLINIYEKVRPQKAELIKELKDINTLRIKLIHRTYKESPDEISASIEKEYTGKDLYTKSLKEILASIVNDNQEILDIVESSLSPPSPSPE